MRENKRQAIVADMVFDGATLYRDGAVIVEGAHIACVCSRRDLPRDIPVRAMPPGSWLAPGFIDVQVNGGGDVLFNDAPMPEAILAIVAAHRVKAAGTELHDLLDLMGNDPETGRPWPAMPDIFSELATSAANVAGFGGFVSDACLINRYIPGAKLSLHQDRNERDYTAPIVSVSLGLPAQFLWGGAARSERPRRIRLENGDVVVWGGPARLAFHGVDTLAAGEHPLTGECRINLTFRKAL